MRIQGHPPNPEQGEIEKSAAEQWRKIQLEAPQQAIIRVEDAAKQLIALTGVLQTLYFAIYAFSDLRQQLGALHIQGWGSLIWLIFCAPIVLWLTSFFFATRVLMPREYFSANTTDISADGWKNVRQTYEKAANQKLRWLRFAHESLVLSFVAVLVVLVTIIIFLPVTSSTNPTPVIIITPTAVATPQP